MTQNFIASNSDLLAIVRKPAYHFQSHAKENLLSKAGKL